eukprot:GHVT01002629.1.p1 GENE.GHVT01002629.1~~GHVT01002629.1.p1  ORF type:complete len:360 (-),score=134.60 GHVT01002629.1:534-1613(-)
MSFAASGGRGGRGGRGSSSSSSSSDPMVEFVPAAFKPSKVSCIKDIQLIKVPKFVADVWNQAEHHSIVGLLHKPTNSQTSSSSSPSSSSSSPSSSSASSSSSSSSSSSVVPELIVPMSLGSCSASPSSRPSSSSPAPFGPVRILRCVSRADECRLILQSRAHPKSTSADIVGEIRNTWQFVPKLDRSYTMMVKQRHLDTDVNKSRTTIEEGRQALSVDSSQTLFRYYNPARPSASGEDDKTAEFGGTRSAVASQRGRGRAVRRQPTLSEDSLKLKVFRALEAVGAEGVQLKDLVRQMDQPYNFVKSVVESIAEQKKRLSDKKMVYVLLSQFNPTNLPPEAGAPPSLAADVHPPTKRAKF